MNFGLILLLILIKINVVIYALNHVLVCMRPEMTMDFEFTKWNRCWVIDREQ